MPTPPLSDDVLAAAVALRQAHPSEAEAARAGGLDRKTLQHRLKRAAERGLMGFSPVLPGFRVSQTTAQYDAAGEIRAQSVQQRPDLGEAFVVPVGHVVKGVSALLHPDGREMLKWVKTREDGVGSTDVIAACKEAMEGYAPAAAPAPAPEATGDNLLTLLPCNDWHLGMHAWGAETQTNWDLKIAERVIGEAVDAVVARSPASAEGVVLGGGDLLHSDSNENRTAKSGNALQVDGRYQKIIGVACRLKVRTIDAMLRRHQRVIVRILPGNHDEHAAVAVAYFLAAWYRNEPRVTVDLDPSLFWWYRFGKVFLGATHGHTVKLQRMPGIMAARRPEDWGLTRFRYVHGFHLHHTAKGVPEDNGVVPEIHRAPIPPDSWHWGAGFLSGRSLQAITYDRDLGDVGRVQAAILDASV